MFQRNGGTLLLCMVMILLLSELPKVSYAIPDTLSRSNTSVSQRLLQKKLIFASKAPNATISSQTTVAAQHIKTLPPTTTRCFKCAGPPSSCDLAFYEDDCLAPDNYCINHVVNKATGQRLIERGCGNVQRCYKDWYLGSSGNHKCRQLSGHQIYTLDFECTYCCIKDSCNFDLHPKQSTLYSPTK